MFSRFQTEYHSNCPTFLKGRLYPVWVSSNFDPLLPNLHPLFTENIQYSQGFAVLYPMNMHFNASIYNFGFPNYRRSFHVTLSCIVLYRYSCKLEHHETILLYGVLSATCLQVLPAPIIHTDKRHTEKTPGCARRTVRCNLLTRKNN